MHSQAEIGVLRMTVALESQPMKARQDAAALLVQLVHDAAPAPTDDDPEVIKLSTPFDRSGESETMRPVNDLIAKMMNGAASGMTVLKAKAAVHEKHRLRAVLALVVDDSEHRLVKLAACQHVLDRNPQIALWSRNSYNAGKLLETAMKAGSIKQTSTGPKPVSRPPLVLADVWEL